LCNYNIPGNDDALKSIQLIVGLMADAILEGRAEREKAHAQRKDDTSAPNAMTTAMASADAAAEAPVPALVGAGKAADVAEAPDAE
jgi:ribosomal protein S2